MAKAIVTLHLIHNLLLLLTSSSHLSWQALPLLGSFWRCRWLLSIRDAWYGISFTESSTFVPLASSFSVYFLPFYIWMCAVTGNCVWVFSENGLLPNKTLRTPVRQQVASLALFPFDIVTDFPGFTHVAQY